MPDSATAEARWPLGFAPLDGLGASGTSPSARFPSTGSPRLRSGQAGQAAQAIGLCVAATPAVFVHAGSPQFRGHRAPAGGTPQVFCKH